MGISVFLLGAFYKTSWSDSTLVDAHRGFERAGFESDPTADTEVVEYDRQTAGSATVDDGRKPMRDAVDALEDSQHIDIRYESGPDSVRVTYRSGPDIGDLPMPVGFGTVDAYKFDPDAVGAEAVTERIERFSDAFAEVANAIDPDVGYLKLRNDHSSMDGIPEGADPSDHGMDFLPFLLYVSDSWVEYCGGHDHVTSAPVHRTETLDTGGVVVQAAERPDLNGDRHGGADFLFGDR